MAARRIVPTTFVAWLSSLLALAQPVRVSEATGGAQANGRSYWPAMSESGRFVAFVSDATNLVTGDTNGVSDVFVRDRDTDADGILDEPGAVRTERVSVATGGAGGNAGATSPGLSADGRYVVFLSSATNLVGGVDGARAQVYRHDRATRETILVSRATTGELPDRDCYGPSISRDGRFAVFASTAVNTAPVPPEGRGGFVYLRDIELGTLTAVSAPLPPPTRSGLAHPRETWFLAGNPYISADGSRVAYSVIIQVIDSWDTYWSGVSGLRHLYDRSTGTSTTDVAGGIVQGLSDDGRSAVMSLGPGHFGQYPSGAGFLDVEAARVDSVDVGAASPPVYPAGASIVAASGSGRHAVVLVTSAPAGPSHPQAGLHFMDGPTLTLTRITGITSLDGAADLDRDGRWLAFATADAMLPSDTNGVADVLVLDLATAFDGDGDGLDDRWEQAVGLSTANGLGADGPAGDPDGDGRTNLEEQEGGGHPRAAAARFFAEGAESAFFTTTFAIVNPGATAATAAFRYVLGAHSVAGGTLLIPARSRRTVDVSALQGVTGAFGTLVESDAALVVERTMQWDASAYAGHSETAAPAPSTTWYFAEGSTSGPFDLFYLLSNPGSTALGATVTYLRPNGLPPVARVYALPPESRTTIQVGENDPVLAATDVAAAIVATGPIVAERAMYLTVPGPRVWRGGVASAGVTAPALDWYLAEGATGPFFELFVLLANPGDETAQVVATFLTGTGDTVTKAYTLAPRSRRTIWVDEEVFDGRGTALASADTSTIVTSTNGVPIVAERTMWWPGGAWEEGHSSQGSTGTGARWAVAGGEEGGPRDVRTYILVANTSGSEAAVAVTLLRENGTHTVRTFTVGPRRRLTIPVRDAFTLAQSGGRFGVLVEGAGAGAGGLVVERATYWSTGAELWSGGTSAPGIRVP